MNANWVLGVAATLLLAAAIYHSDGAKGALAFCGAVAGVTLVVRWVLKIVDGL